MPSLLQEERKHIGNDVMIFKAGVPTKHFAEITKQSMNQLLYPSSLRVNANRLYETIHHSCQWGAEHRYDDSPHETGMARLTLSDADKQVRHWLIDEVRKLDCNVKTDAMGNIFAVRQGKTYAGKPMIAMGSHLDTQPRGGRYDGILGVLAGLEVLRTLVENGWQTHYDVGIVNWTNEEGARFPKSMCASSVWAGKTPIQDAWELQDVSDTSITLLSELKRIGFLGKRKCTYKEEGIPLGAHFELHIEQGPILECEEKDIGVVLGGQAYRWVTVIVKGRDAHTGTTPFHNRKDPVLAAAKMIATASEIAKYHDALASVCFIDTPQPWSVNTIASSTRFTLDIRHPKTDVVSQVQDQCLKRFSEIAEKDGKGVELTWKLDTDSAAAHFDKDCVDAVRQSAIAEVGEDKVMNMLSGAGHDSVNTSSVCPTAMIFVPCKDGISHNPIEFSTLDQCAKGAQVLLDAVLRYDEFRAGREEV